MVDKRAQLEPDPKVLEWQLDWYRDGELSRVVMAIEPLGGPEVVASGFEVAENERAPSSVRRAALLVVSRHLDPRDAPGRARGAALWERVAKRISEEEAAVVQPVVQPAHDTHGNVANASKVVAGMAAGFRHCYNLGLQEDPDMRGSVRIKARIGADGMVLRAEHSGGDGLSSLVISCVAMRVALAQFAAPEGGGATIVIPITFVSQP
jgi:hypothetical protein